MTRLYGSKQLKIAVIGGGTGSFTLLSGLKLYTDKLTALVNMSDDGGSTGRLRDELGVLPPGDVRQCLVALSDTPKLRELFSYRFDEGDLKGHVFGNLFLTALEKTTGSFAEGIGVASEVLNITGSVEPITHTDVRLVMEKCDGEIIHGQHFIDCGDYGIGKPKLWLEPVGEVNPKAVTAIMDADIVVIAPGSLYSSLAPALIVPGVGEALAKSKAFKIYVCNLVTKPGQTDGYDVGDFADEIERLASDCFLDAVLYNTEKPDKDLLEKYAADGELAVDYNEDKLQKFHYVAVGAKLLSGKIWSNNSKADQLAATRTLIRHDPKATARAIVELYENESLSR